MRDIATILEEPETTVAVVGATDNPSKYGHVIYRDLKRKGYTVFPVNPYRTKVDDDKTYRTLSDLPDKPTIVNIVIPPSETVKVLQQCLEQNLMNVWLQPGSESRGSLTMLQEHGFNYLANTCIMVQSRDAQRSR